jgi:hypothetical protein
MKTFKKASVRKLVTRFDNDLKAILLNDIKMLRTAKVTLLNGIKPSMAPDNLSVA